MTKGRVSVIIPSRNERFLLPTIRDVLSHATGDLEVIAVLDGEAWPSEPFPDDPRLIVLRRNVSRGMRHGINSAAAIASGEWLLKCDAHVSLTAGYDEVLKTHCDHDWVLTLRRDRLDAENWRQQEVRKPPIDYHFLSNPLERPGDESCGLHGQVWPQRSLERLSVPLDETMSSQGSFYFMHRRCWAERVGPLNDRLFTSFWDEYQEVGLKVQLSGGKSMLLKTATVLHWHKGPVNGRGYKISKPQTVKGLRHSARFWMLEQWLPEWPTKQRTLLDLIRSQWPVPTWGDDPERVFHEARSFFAEAA